MTTLRLPTYDDVAAAAARIDGHAYRTPVLTSRTADAELGARIFFKCENFQRIGAFKFRGAYNALARFDERQRRAGVVAFSSGNHAGSALALVEAGQRVVGAAELERADALEVLALEEDARTELGVGGARRQHRRAVRLPLDARRRRDDVLVGRQAQRRHGRVASARWILIDWPRRWRADRFRRATAPRSRASPA